jgi:hypothetical protein
VAYFDTGRASNGGTEAINGLIELHRRIAHGFRNRDNYRLRMLLIGGGLTHPPPQVRRAALLGAHSPVLLALHTACLHFAAVQADAGRLVPALVIGTRSASTKCKRAQNPHKVDRA